MILTNGEMMDIETGKLLQDWYFAKSELDRVKERERILRDQLVAKFRTSEDQEGSVGVDIGAGYKLRIAFGLNRTVDVAAWSAIESELRDAGADTINLINWKPTLSIKEYNNLTADQRAIMDACVESKPKTPTLTIVEPKL